MEYLHNTSFGDSKAHASPLCKSSLCEYVYAGIGATSVAWEMYAFLVCMISIKHTQRIHKSVLNILCSLLLLDIMHIGFNTLGWPIELIVSMILTELA